MKYEWRKHEKNLYGTKKQPTLTEVPSQKFIMISGKGNPNNPDFSERVGVLYSSAYGIKMRYKKCYKTNIESNTFEYDDYTVFPLEGVWSSSEDPLDKDSLEYTIMIRQPDFIIEDDFKESLEIVKKKKPHSLLEEVSFESLKDNLSVQMLHVGPFDNEPESFEVMDKFLEENNLERISSTHREIYLNNGNRTDPLKYKTILRYQVKKV